MLKMAVLVSGGGTNLQAIIDSIANGTITNAEISVVISNNANAYALERAKKHGIEARCISPKQYETREAFNEALLAAIHESFDLSRCLEFTVEGGRPDTLDREKLQVIKNGGATRISINPQTMADDVLENVGRKHTSAQTLEAFHQAREVGFEDINMDLIAGLPGDTAEKFAASLSQVLALHPSNVTVHTLALKKGANLFQNRTALPSREAVGQMLHDAEQALRACGFEPYYLYRQKYMSGSFENTGWCKPGFTGWYNIYMMEELHTILSLGGGGMNKINLPAGQLERFHNPKSPQDYIARIDTILQQKDEIFEILHRLAQQPPAPIEEECE